MRTGPAPAGEETEAAPALHLENITKRFGDFKANDDVSLVVRRGEVVALLGENGAGKTTLMNILFGHYSPDSGKVSVFGRELPTGRPRAAIDAGVGMVHQHFTLAPNLTVLENVAAGTQSLWAWKLDRRKVRARLADLSERFGLSADPDRLVGDLSVGEQQRTEILKALYNETAILVLDEPTAVLTPPEAERLFTTLRRMAAAGLSVIFISHKLHEVLSAADRVVVLRAGRVVGEAVTSRTNRDELAELMVGRRVTRPVREGATAGAVVLEASSIGFTANGRRLLDGASFELRAGEILGLIGVSGNGQAALASILFGLAQPTAGTLEIFGKRVVGSSARQMIALGLGRVPEDRNAEGLIGDMTLWENAVLERVRDGPFSGRFLVNRPAARTFANKIMKDFDVRGASPDERVRLLSGGNMQKLILGRNLERKPRILVAAQPTRGLDEGAMASVHTALLAARRENAGILLISEDLDEVMRLSDRVIAIHRGRLSDAIPTEGLDARRLGLMIAGEHALPAA